MVRTVRLLVSGVAGAVFLGFLGCGESGPRPYPVSGTVKFTDGTPVTTGMIMFNSADSTAAGAITEDGTFEVSCNKPGDGAIPGVYQVTISAFVEVPPPEGMTASEAEVAGKMPPPKLLVAGKYGNAATSGLQYTVEPGKNHFDITVDRPEGQ